ncbi:MAG: hypothetical protein ACLQU2_02435, partial [Candidatus Binataceae bacterium]
PPQYVIVIVKMEYLVASSNVNRHKDADFAFVMTSYQMTSAIIAPPAGNFDVPGAVFSFSRPLG